MFAELLASHYALLHCPKNSKAWKQHPRMNRRHRFDDDDVNQTGPHDISAWHLVGTPGRGETAIALNALAASSTGGADDEQLDRASASGRHFHP
jgi:hypothetical protein